MPDFYNQSNARDTPHKYKKWIVTVRRNINSPFVLQYRSIPADGANESVWDPPAPLSVKRGV